jgi:hypothetical protein
VDAAAVGGAISAFGRSALGKHLLRNGSASVKKNELKPWRQKEWLIPPEASAEFVCAMEHILDLYQRPYNEQEPVVCVDEKSKQLIAEVREPLPMEPGKPLRYDSHYERRGTVNVFLAFEPLRNWRGVRVTKRRTGEDFAHFLRWLSDEIYPEARTIHVVLDNLNTHKLAVLYKAFPATEARRIAKRLQFHYTPKHGSWLNMAEIELSVLSRQALADRMSDEETVRREVTVWAHERNQAGATIDWRFTTDDARIKLKHLYPSFSA